MKAKQQNKTKAQLNKLKQYYADDMLDADEWEGATIIQRNAVLEEEHDEEDEQVNLDDEATKERLRKEHMDKISDIIVNMIFKNVRFYSRLIFFRKSILKTPLIFPFQM